MLKRYCKCGSTKMLNIIMSAIARKVWMSTSELNLWWPALIRIRMSKCRKKKSKLTVMIFLLSTKSSPMSMCAFKVVGGSAKSFWRLAWCDLYLEAELQFAGGGLYDMVNVETASTTEDSGRNERTMAVSQPYKRHVIYRQSKVQVVTGHVIAECDINKSQRREVDRKSLKCEEESPVTSLRDCDVTKKCAHVKRTNQWTERISPCDREVCKSL